MAGLTHSMIQQARQEEIWISSLFNAYMSGQAIAPPLKAEMGAGEGLSFNS